MVFVFIEILFKIVLFKGGVLIYAEHCIYIYIYIYIYIILLLKRTAGLNKLIITLVEDRNKSKYGHKRETHETYDTGLTLLPLPEGMSLAVAVPLGGVLWVCPQDRHG